MAKTNKIESYDKKQCIYGEDSSMICSFCSAVCTARMADMTEKQIDNLDESLKSILTF